MKGDFTRDTFLPIQHFSRVLMQQGRVQLDADWNEQVAILLHYMQALATDLIGPQGGPLDNLGFGITINARELGLADAELKVLKQLERGDFWIERGHYYVDGILCENDGAVRYTLQERDMLTEKLVADRANSYLVYLDVWERHVGATEQPDLREVALGGPDTATRAKIEWQVKALQFEGNADSDLKLVTGDDQFAYWNLQIQKLLDTKAKPEPIAEARQKLAALASTKMLARTKRDAKPEDPCTISPNNRYRGAENQLYRVEIHRSGEALKDDGSNAANCATFKWSRDNGAISFRVAEVENGELRLEHLGYDKRSGLDANDWAELVSDNDGLAGTPGLLFQVRSVSPANQEVIPKESFTQEIAKKKGQLVVRRWDQTATGGTKLQTDGSLALQEGKLIELEDGVQVQFDSGPDDKGGGYYRSGDYWLIPARTATGTVSWPGGDENPTLMPPNGVAHHYARLASIAFNPPNLPTIVDLRHWFKPLSQLPPPKA